MTHAARFAFLAVLPLLAVAPTVASGDVIKLRTGETVKGRVVAERSNEGVLVVEDFLTGGTRELAWEVLTDDDKTRIQTDLSIILGAKGDTTVDCWSLTIRQGDNTTTDIRGVIESEDATYVYLRYGGQREPLRIEKSRITSREKDVCDKTDIWRPEELAAEKKDDLKPADAKTFMLWAQYCERVGAYVEAKEGYDNAATDETYLNRAAAQAGSARMASLIADKEARDDLRNLKNLLSFLQFKSVRDGIEAFPTKHPNASESVTKALEALKAQYEAKRKTYFAAEAGKKYVPIVLRLIEPKVRPKDAAINDVLSWSKKELVDDSFGELAKRFQEKDPIVTADDAKAFWGDRPKKANIWNNARYGSGSFLIEPPTIKPPTNQPRPQPGKGGSSSGGGQANIPIPKPPTRDTWWEKADTSTRRDWVFANYVEKSGFFEVAPQRDKTNCVACEGVGLITKMTSGGGALTYLCPRCGGARYDLTVKYH